MLLTIEFSAAPAHIDVINSEALPVNYSVCCVFVEVADNSTTHNTVILYSAKGSLSHRRRHTSSNGGLTRGKRHQTQTCALARSTVWAKLHLILNINIFTGGYGLQKFLFQ